jgi:TonB family protein
VTLRKNVRLGPAIRMRGATVFLAVPACALVFLLASNTTLAVGTPQSGHSDKNVAVPAARKAYAKTSSSPSSSESAGEVSSSGQTTFPTHQNLQLTLKADCANVEIFTDASNEVSYSVRLDPKITGPEAGALSRESSLKARNTRYGVVLIVPPATEGDSRVRVNYIIHVPRRYNLDIVVQSGDIITQDIEGGVTLITGGGNIEVGIAGTSDRDARFPARTTFTVRLETAGGNISIGDVVGGLHAATAGGRIAAHDVHGPAVLRTGGGDIHVGHVFGPARFISGGGDIDVQKVDGGLWADTAGGRIAIGNAARATAFAPGSSNSRNNTFPMAVTRLTREQQETSPTSDVADITTFARVFDSLVWGGIRVDPADQQKRLSQALAPDYPDVARWAGIEGEVTLRIFIGADGTVRSIVPLSGPPVLARAAMRAVEQWRYAPALVDGHPVDIVTTVTLAFRLHP